MSEVRTGAVSFKGNPVDLVGPELKVGAKAPDFALQRQDMSEETLASSAGTRRVILTMPSLDTPVCATETRRFNEEVGKLQGVTVLAVSMDLPFAQKRWCGAEGVEGVRTLSAHRSEQFGHAYGVSIAAGPLTRLLARAVFVVDGDGTLRHVEYVKDIASEPDYAAALRHVR